ncbi:hypothetical protein PDESU_00429 [Pontiella desulfatans]|uniref:Uncharacterized protein n=1 Tax=Pontiella desulfatans TaxID=2750659 RepID=A0A6C2TX37_PONDE|nr:hypothetical protein PDESU_00429 [Pontiella desulfatans]
MPRSPPASCCYTGTLAIEREAGNTRIADIQLAAERLKGI